MEVGGDRGGCILPRQQFEKTGPGTGAPLLFPPPVASALEAERAKQGCVKGREGLTERNLTRTFSTRITEEPRLDTT